MSKPDGMTLGQILQRSNMVRHPSEILAEIFAFQFLVFESVFLHDIIQTERLTNLVM